LQAVDAVESGGNGFLANGQLKILFEPHIFWKQLRMAGISPEGFAKKHPGILSPVWDAKLYSLGGSSYDKLDIAKRIHEEAALKSASWGRYQIMGFNHVAAGYTSVRDMVAAYSLGEVVQLKSFCRYIMAVHLDDELKAQDWAGFARGYNGPQYWKNKYDKKLEQAFLKFSKNG
jgi:hypothetical protein